MIDRRAFLSTGVAVLGAGLAGCAGGLGGGGWVTLLDGSRMTSFDGWSPLGAGEWSFTEGTLQGKNGKMGYLVSKDAYTDFEILAEFWADEPCNSGIFIRCQDRNKVGSDNAYEVNIFDKRPDPSYGTGAIVDIAKVSPMPKAAGKWNVLEVIAKGPRMIVVLNGQQTVDASDAKFRSGPVALQSAAGTIRFRKVQIRNL